VTVHYQDDWLTVLHGDALTELATLPAESVHCVVTSPPYWGLRDYGQPGQLGLEPTPEEYVTNMVAVFREVRRVLRSDGTVWLNLGDSYAGSGATSGNDVNGQQGEVGSRASWAKGEGKGIGEKRHHPPSGLKPKDLVGIPWRVAFALQQPYYTGIIPDERDRTWLAALLDGEGTFTILCTTSPHGSGNSYPPIAQIRMTSEAVVQRAASLVGVASPAQYPPSNRGNRAVYQWRLSGGRAAAVAREMYPYLIEKRKQALIVWNHQVVRDSYETKRGVTIPAAALAKQRVCRDLIRRLNHGEDVDIPSWMVEPPGMTEPGWYLRSDVIWAKPNPMPESVTDRPTKSHEYLFLLAKSQRYYFDADAVREPHTGGSGWEKSHADRPSRNGFGSGELAAHERFGENPSGRNIRTVWTIATAPYPGAHFATFPPKLVEPCIKAGTSERGVCPECGAPWERVVEREGGERYATGKSAAKNGQGLATAFSGYTDGSSAPTFTTTGWRPPDCGHRDTYTGLAPAPIPAVVLDPFAGSGTTGMVAQSLSRRAILIDLSVDYLGQLLERNRDIPLGLGA